MSSEELVKQYALKKFEERKALAAETPKIDNSKLYAGSPMYFYCNHCGGLADTVPEDYIFKPRHVCSQCEAMIEHGYLNAGK